jgi:peptide/nickel transport system substrate-binding protein
MKKLRWQLIIIFLTGLVVGGLLLSEQPTIAPISATPVPETGGIYKEALIGAMQRLNPILDFNNQVDQDVDRLIYSSLLRFDARGLPQPDLAEEWGMTKDGTIYNVTLRSGVKWHDGQPLTTDDVLFTINLIRSGGAYVPEDLQILWTDIEVKVLSETRMQFLLPEPSAPFQDYLTFGVLPKHIYEGQSIDAIAKSEANLKPIGSGPYKVDRILSNNNQITGVVLSIYAGYYSKKPFIEQIVFSYYPDGPSAWQAYQDGQVQGISRVTSDILQAVLASPTLSVYTSRMPEMSLVLFNHKDPQAVFLKEPAVRKALMAGLNRPFMINRILNGQAIIANGPIMPENWAYYSNTDKFDYSPTNAISLLKDAGYVPGDDKNSVRKKGDVRLAFELIYPDNDTYRALAEQIGKDWAAIGVQIIANPLPFDQLFERLDQRNYQAALVTLNLTNAYDPDPYPFWDQAQMTGGQNYTQWDNRIASELLEQARMTVDLNERIHYYRNFQVVFSQEMPALPLYYPVYSYAVDRQVQGVSVAPLFDPSDRFAMIQQWFLVAKKSSTPATEVPTVTK